jgi:hypothetical protein
MNDDKKDGPSIEFETDGILKIYGMIKDQLLNDHSEFKGPGFTMTLTRLEDE